MDLRTLTPEKRARFFVNFYPHNDALVQQMSDMMANLISNAVLEEREANAAIAEAEGSAAGAWVAEQIRARS